MLNSCSHLSDVEYGNKVHGYPVKLHLVGSALSEMYRRCGNFGNLQEGVEGEAVRASPTTLNKIAT